ncbi:MAG: alpha/beta hydrolase [Actinomycetota bacterium]
MEGAEEKITPVVLVHGGLAEDMDAERFWTRPGITGGLMARGFEVIAEDRDTSPASWPHAANELAATIESTSDVVAASNGVSVAVRLALQYPRLVNRLLLLRPATAGDERVDAAWTNTVEHLLSGDTLRGIADAELATLDHRVAVMAAEPDNPVHQRRTVERLLALIPSSTELTPGCPEPPHPGFAPYLPGLLAHLTSALSEP